MNFEAEIIAEIYFCTEFDYFEYTRNATENNLKFLFFAFFAYFSYDVSSNFEHTRDNQTWLKKNYFRYNLSFKTGPPTARKSADRNNQRGPLQIKYFRLIKNLYWQQTASAKTDDGFTASFPIKRGVRQGCVLSPPLFNVYIVSPARGWFKEILCQLL